jgi:hypothetical protein
LKKYALGVAGISSYPQHPTHKLKEFLNYLTKDKKAAMEY